MVALPLGHPPLDFMCSYAPRLVAHILYWQKNSNSDGIYSARLRLGQAVPPSCEKVAAPAPPPLYVTCVAYRGFVVKSRERLWGSDVGVAGVSIIPIRPGQAAPPCDGKIVLGEFLLFGTDQSRAKFWGVVGQYVFLVLPDTDLFGALHTEVFRSNLPEHIGWLTRPPDYPDIWLTRAPGGFDFHFWAEQEGNCAVSGGTGAACLAQIERAAGTKISLEQCRKAEIEDKPYKPIALFYPALLSVRGASFVLRATGPATSCIASL